MSNKKKQNTPPKKANTAKAKQPTKSDRIWTIFGVAVCVCLLVMAIIAVLPKESKREMPPTPNVDSLQENQRFYATIDIVEYGTIKVELDHTQAPITVENFVTLAKSKFYDGLTFHRIIKDFMMQGGATSIPSKQPGNVIGEFKANGYDNNIAHKRGVISMARADGYNSGSSQFFIMQVTKSHLDGYYAAFGRVVEGIEVVDAICDTIEASDDNGTIEVMDRPVIDTITISIETVS